MRYACPRLPRLGGGLSDGPLKISVAILKYEYHIRMLSPEFKICINLDYYCILSLCLVNIQGFHNVKKVRELSMAINQELSMIHNQKYILSEWKFPHKQLLYQRVFSKL